MEWIQRKYLGEMAKVKEEIQIISLFIDSAHTNYLANRRYRKWKPLLRALTKMHKALQKKYQALGKEAACTSQKLRNTTSGTFTG